MSGVLGAVFDVFTSVAGWIAEAVAELIPMFYVAETGLTFLGVLATASLAISVAFLIIGVSDIAPTLLSHRTGGHYVANEEAQTLSY